MTTRVGALQSPGVGKAFQYMRHVCPTSRIFLGASEVKLFSEKWSKSTAGLGQILKFVPDFLKKLVFLAFPAIKTDSCVV